MYYCKKTFSSQTGFLLISAGCAIGRKYLALSIYCWKIRRRCFCLLYLLFLIVSSWDCRSWSWNFLSAVPARRNVPVLWWIRTKGTKWHLYTAFGIAGSICDDVYHHCRLCCFTSLKWPRGFCRQTPMVFLCRIQGNLMGQPVLMTVLWLSCYPSLYGVCPGASKRGWKDHKVALMICLLAVLNHSGWTCGHTLEEEGGAEGLRYIWCRISIIWCMTLREMLILGEAWFLRL